MDYSSPDNIIQRLELILDKRINNLESKMKEEDKCSRDYTNQQATSDTKKLEDIIVELREKIKELKDENRYKLLEDNISKKIQALQAEFKKVCTRDDQAETKDIKSKCDCSEIYDAIKSLEKKVDRNGQNQLRPDDNTKITDDKKS